MEKEIIKQINEVLDNSIQNTSLELKGNKKMNFHEFVSRINGIRNHLIRRIENGI